MNKKKEVKLQGACLEPPATSHWATSISESYAALLQALLPRRRQWHLQPHKHRDSEHWVRDEIPIVAAELWPNVDNGDRLRIERLRRRPILVHAVLMRVNFLVLNGWREEDEDTQRGPSHRSADVNEWARVVSTKIVGRLSKIVKHWSKSNKWRGRKILEEKIGLGLFFIKGF